MDSEQCKEEEEEGIATHDKKARECGSEKDDKNLEKCKRQLENGMPLRVEEGMNMDDSKNRDRSKEELDGSTGDCSETEQEEVQQEGRVDKVELEKGIHTDDKKEKGESEGNTAKLDSATEDKTNREELLQGQGIVDFKRCRANLEKGMNINENLHCGGATEKTEQEREQRDAARGISRGASAEWEPRAEREVEMRETLLHRDKQEGRLERQTTEELTVEALTHNNNIDPSYVLHRLREM